AKRDERRLCDSSCSSWRCWLPSLAFPPLPTPGLSSERSTESCSEAESPARRPSSCPEACGARTPSTSRTSAGVSVLWARLPGDQRPCPGIKEHRSIASTLFSLLPTTPSIALIV
ncbi:hypothetical protein PMAYCL1PPCAC_11323, partial [Pristionchus mayeri]